MMWDQRLGTPEEQKQAEALDAWEQASFDLGDLSPVSAEELSFALSIFVNAGNSRLQRPPCAGGTPGFEARRKSRRLLARLSVDRPALQQLPEHAPMPGEATLDAAFLALWQQYEGDARQTSICARVLRFHYLMVRTEGAAIEPWLTACPGSPGLVEMHPAVISALSSAVLTPEGMLPEQAFLDQIAGAAAESSHDRPSSESCSESGGGIMPQRPCGTLEHSRR